MKRSELIEGYILGHLTGTDLAKFERELRTNDDLKKELLLTRKIMTSVTQKDFSDTQNFIKDSIARRKGKSKERYQIPLIYRIAATVVLLIASTLIIYNVSNTNSSHDELFNEHFKIYPNLITERTEGTAGNALDSAMKCYDRRDFECAIHHFNKLNAPQEDAVEIYEGVSYLALGITDSAIMVFNKTIKSTNIDYSNQAKFYKSLCLIKEEKIKEAKQLLVELKNNGSSYYKSQAVKILEELR